MEPASSPAVESPESFLDYSFGFDNTNFSDRNLLLEIINDPESKPDPDDKVFENAIEVFPAAAAPPRVKTIHINSLILAARSPFFRKLFSNGLGESEQRRVTLRIEASEEVSFMDLLNYIYSNNLPTTLFALLDVLEIAEKFEVVSCLRDCSRSLQNLPMTCESAWHYLDLPPSLLMSPTIQPLIDAAKHSLVAHFKDIDKFKEEVLNLPLAGIQTVVSSDGLRVASECAVYDLVLTWAREHYPDLEERRGILNTHLLHLVRFPFMTTSKLIEEVLTCSDIDHELASNIVIRALHFKAETPHRQRCLAAEKGNAASRQFVERAYTFRPVKVVEFELPRHQQCIVYLNLKLEEVTHIFPDGHIRSETFHLVGQQLTLFVKRVLDERTSDHFFLLYLVMQVVGSAAYTVNYEIALRLKPWEEFVSNLLRGSHTFTQGPGSIKYLLVIPWTDFLADHSPYFINGILNLRADLTIKK